VQAGFLSSRPHDSGTLKASLFAYGTLTIDSVIGTLLGRVPTFEDVQVDGWRAVRLPDRPYPGLIEAATGSALGRAYTGLTVTDWDLLDEFEDPNYRLIWVQAQSRLSLLTYIWPDQGDGDAWDNADFVDNHLGSYLDRCRRWKYAYQERRDHQ
jgi:gamma-glutamylcyclotransferase (GGCT)/AIG2-like uncharacterized protein YtfP